MDKAQIEQILAEFRRSVNVIQATGIGQLFGGAHFPSFLGRSLSMMAGATSEQDAALTARLSEIPTETTTGERKLLYNFFVNYWDGKHDVLEIGPFLGGSTRAMALGMLHSSNRQEHVKLYTYDKFREYYQPERLLQTLQPMFAAGILDEQARAAIQDRGQFLDVYRLLHQGHDYSDLIVAQAGALPDAPDQTPEPEEAFDLPADRDYSAVFVDGAKSWYGTKAFMNQSLAHTFPGAFYFFQDYGAHTCFWIPVLLEVLKEHFRLMAYVDHTYVFQQLDGVSEREVAAAFPDSPLDFSAADFQRIFRNLYATALEQDNTYTLLNYQLQHAAALSYLGHIEEARDRIVDLLKTPHGIRYRDWILNALRAPTYRPDGNVNLF